MILVVGATGTVGTSLAEQLILEEIAVRVLTRKPEKAEKFRERAEIAVGNLDDPHSLRSAIEGVSKIFLLTSSTQQDRNVLATAKEAGVSHIVKLSTQEAGWTPVEGHGHWHKEREELIRASGMAWTFLRPTMFMNYALSWIPSIRESGKVLCAGGDAKIAPIDPWDVAAVAKEALIADGHENVGYELTGPALVNFPEMVATIARVTNRAIERIDIPESEQEQVFLKMGVPTYVAAGLSETFGLIRAGRFSYLTSNVKMVTGREPRSFEEWVLEHARLFQ